MPIDKVHKGTYLSLMYMNDLFLPVYFIPILISHHNPWRVFLVRTNCLIRTSTYHSLYFYLSFESVQKSTQLSKRTF